MDEQLRKLERDAFSDLTEEAISTYILTRRRKEPPTANATKYQIPFNPVSEMMMNYEQSFWEYTVGAPAQHIKPVLKDNYFWVDALCFSRFDRGRSAAHAFFASVVDKNKTENRLIYQMFLTDLHDCMRLLKEGYLIGVFTFVKRGANYGVKYLGKHKLIEEPKETKKKTKTKTAKPIKTASGIIVQAQTIEQVLGLDDISS